MKRLLNALTRRPLLGVAALLVALALGGFLVAATGIIPLKASSGHWAITEWFLHFSMERSIATHTLGLKAPPLNEPHLIARGAGHFEIGCFPCHGNPKLHHPRIAAAMLPPPPYLPPRIREWKPEELFYLVKHGVKFTGMPAWPAQHRDDEVWAVVAFLLELPELDAEEYRRLARGEDPDDDEAAPLLELTGPDAVTDMVLTNCARCHGVDGRGRDGAAFPNLAGQHADYLAASLRAYAHGERPSGIMEPIAAGLDENEMRQLADHYAAQAPAASPTQREGLADVIAHGKSIAHDGLPERRVAACVDCHGNGNDAVNPAFPSLAGQYAEYLVLQLGLFQQGHRGGTDYAHLMNPIAPRLEPDEIRAVALYFESLDPSPQEQPGPP